MVASAAMATPLGTYQGPFYANWPCCSLPTMPASDASVNGQYGTAVRRREDPPLIQGTGTYTDDVDAPGALHAHFVRSEVAHGRILGIDTAAAAAAPGVAGVFTGADLDLGPFPPGPMAPDDMLRPTLARDVVRFQGEAIAVVVAESRAAAVDAAELVEVDIEPLDVIVDPERALEDGAPQLFADKGSNLAFQGGNPDEGALEGADVVVRSRFVNQRLAAVPMEPSATVAVPDPESGGVRIWAPLQAPHTARDVFAGALGLEQDAVHVTVPNVGGGFGARIAAYPEQAAVAAAALRLGKPVRYVESRWETMIAMQHGRAQVQDVELGARSDGTLVGIRVHVIADCGAYPGDAVIMPFLTGQMASGVYAIPRVDFSFRCVGHQHDADRRLPRRRAPGGDRAHRARHEPAGREARHGPGRAAPAQLHRARRLPPQDGRGRHV